MSNQPSDAEGSVADARDSGMPEPRTPAPASGGDSRIPGLDGLRGVAALIVMCSHMSLREMHLLPGLDLEGTGKTGVYLFFVLSAFLLSTQMIAWGRPKFLEPRRWADYLIGRTFRIWPLFLVVVALCHLTSIWDFPLKDSGIPVQMGRKALFETLMLRRGDKILWTIPVEFKFYFVLPPIVAVCLFVLRGRRIPSILALLAAATFAFATLPPRSVDTRMLPFIGIFLGGVAGAFAWDLLRRAEFGPRTRAAFEVLAWGSLLVWATLIPAFATWWTGGRLVKKEIIEAHPVFTALWVSLIVGMLGGTGFMRRLLDGRIPKFLGEISYSFYLLHLCVVEVLARASLPGPVRAWLSIPGAVLLAWISYRLIEKPVLGFSGRLRARLRSAGRPSAEPREAPGAPSNG